MDRRSDFMSAESKPLIQNEFEENILKEEEVNPSRWIVPQGNTAAVAEVRRAAWDVQDEMVGE